MTVTPNPNDLPAVLEQLQQAEPDLLRSMLTAFVQALISAEADAQCGAEYGSRRPDRTNRRNGYRHREWDTRAGTIELAIPNSAKGRTIPTDCSSGTSGPNEPLSRLSRPATCSGCRPGGWRSWTTSSASPDCRSPRCR